MSETARSRETGDDPGTGLPQRRTGHAFAHPPHRSDGRPPQTPRGARQPDPGGRPGTIPPVPGRPYHSPPPSPPRPAGPRPDDLAGPGLGPAARARREPEPRPRAHGPRRRHRTPRRPRQHPGRRTGPGTGDGVLRPALPRLGPRADGGSGDGPGARADRPAEGVDRPPGPAGALGGRVLPLGPHGHRSRRLPRRGPAGPPVRPPPLAAPPGPRPDGGHGLRPDPARLPLAPGRPGQLLPVRTPAPRRYAGRRAGGRAGTLVSRRSRPRGEADTARAAPGAIRTGPPVKASSPPRPAPGPQPRASRAPAAPGR